MCDKQKDSKKKSNIGGRKKKHIPSGPRIVAQGCIGISTTPVSCRSEISLNPCPTIPQRSKKTLVIDEM